MRQNLLLFTIGVAILNGIFSPFMIPVFLLYPLWYPSWAPATTEAVAAIASIIVSTLTLMISGVAASLVERARGQAETDSVSAGVWLAGAILLSLPAFLGVFAPSGI